MIDIDRMWRAHPDSRGRGSRVLCRVFLGPGKLPAAIAFYERLQSVQIDSVIPFPAKSLRLAVVGAFLLIEGGEAELEPFRSTTTTIIVDDVEPYYRVLVEAGAEIIFPLQQVPSGAAFNAVHPDGAVVEYVHHRPDPDGR